MTDKARIMEKSMHELLQADEELFFRGFSEEEKEALFAALEKVKQNIREEEDQL